MSHNVQAFYDEAYRSKGLGAQRRYPNEELCRFIGGRYLDKTTHQERATVKILEVGCGSGANLWMLVREGFAVYGLDIAQAAVELCRERISPHGHAHVQQGNMLHSPYADGFFDVVCDVFSANYFLHTDYLAFLGETARILKPGGLFFFFTPSTESDAFTNHAPSVKLDAYTLDGIQRQTSPFCGNSYPFHFLDQQTLDTHMPHLNMQRLSLEKCSRTYRSMEEGFTFLVGVYQKMD